MNKSNMVKLAESIVKMVEGKENKTKFSLNDSLTEMPVIKRAQEEIDIEMCRNICSINEMAKDGFIFEGVHFKSEIDVDGDHVLIINYLSFYEKFLAYCKLKEMMNELFTLDEFKTLLRTQSYCKSYNKPVWFENTLASYSDISLYRSAVLKIDELKEKNINISALAEYGGKCPKWTFTSNYRAGARELNCSVFPTKGRKGGCE